jgi:uncharacterized protein
VARGPGKKDSGSQKARIPGESAGSQAHRTGGDRGPSAAADPPGAREEVAAREKYCGNTVMLMARDPYWCYAFWDIAEPFLEEKKKELKPEWGSARLCLRVYDVTEAGTARQKDIIIKDTVGNIYINIWTPAHVYQAEAGLITDDRHYIALAKSNRIEAPPDSSVESADGEWKADKEDLREIFTMPADQNTGADDMTRDDKGGRR